MLRRNLRRQLSFVPTILVLEWIGNVRERRLSSGIGVLIPTGAEEPQTVADDASAESSLICMIEVVERIHLADEIGLVRPTRVCESVAQRAGILVASRFGDRGDHSAGEAAKFRRDAAGEYRRLLNRVFD